MHNDVANGTRVIGRSTANESARGCDYVRSFGNCSLRMGRLWDTASVVSSRSAFSTVSNVASRLRSLAVATSKNPVAFLLLLLSVQLAFAGSFLYLLVTRGRDFLPLSTEVRAKRAGRRTGAGV